MSETVETIMVKRLLDEINLANVCDHYELRMQTSHQLRQIFEKGAILEYCKLALGISESSGNYSASEHKLGPRIFPSSADAAFRLATTLDRATSADEILTAIYSARIPYLKISVGSEMAMMLRPNQFWVANVRSVWTHLLVKHRYSLSKANNELALYRDDDRSSEMDYKIWKSIYKTMQTDLVEIGRQVSLAAKGQLPDSNFLYLWCDAVANELYAQEHE